MPQIINTNIASLNAQRNLNKSQSQYQTALQRLSSGLRINSAADDPAGLAIASRFQAQINGTGQAIKNANDGVNLAQTAGSALSSITDNLQRIRELAVQSANDTNSSTDRKSLQQEVTQLKQEIQNTAKTTNFNGKSLLDGSFQNQQFQVGANVGQTIAVSLNKVDTTTLGTAQSAGISGQLTSAEAAGSTSNSPVSTLASGDLVINGVAVGAASGSSDTSSTNLQADSAIAKASAINAVSSQSGVSATANATVASGNFQSGISAATTFDLTLNNQKITINASKALTSSDLQTQESAIASQINQYSGSTGVQASVVANNDGTNYRIDLTAQDGRNIQLSTSAGGLTSAVGLASASNADGRTYVGTVTLNSTNGSDINLGTNTGNIDTSGFAAGTYSAGNGGAVAQEGTTTTSGSGNKARSALTAGDLLINGVDVGGTQASSDTSSTTANSSSGISLAAAINSVSDKTGVSAKVNATNVYVSDLQNSSLGTAGTKLDFKVNGKDISFAVGADASSTQANILSAVNASSGQTGVTASAIGSKGFALTAADGRNIDIASGTADYLSASKLDGSGSVTGIKGVTTSSVTLESAGQFTLGSATGDIGHSGFQVGTYGGTENGTKVSNIDISTVSGANDAIKAVDNALNTISTNQATLGAVQNRFSATVSTLTSLSNNLTSAQSSIQDADFAKQTAALSRAQVLQQAGISILAQANAQPKQVLSLLQ